MRPKILLHVDKTLLTDRIFECTDEDAIRINEKIINGYFKNRGRKPPLAPEMDGLFFVQLGRYLLLSITWKKATRMLLVDHQVASFSEFEKYAELMQGTTGSMPALIEGFYAAKLNYHHFIDDFETSKLEHPEAERKELRQRMPIIRNASNV